MKRSTLLSAGVLSLSLCTSLPVFASSPADLPPEQTQGAVTYRSGGIGHTEAQAFEAAASHYPLAMEFAVKHAPRAGFTADVHVTITDMHGKRLLDTQEAGPFLLVKLPAGHYTVTAEQQGHLQTKKVEVAPTKSAHTLFMWTA